MRNAITVYEPAAGCAKQAYVSPLIHLPLFFSLSVATGEAGFINTAPLPGYSVVLVAVPGHFPAGFGFQLPQRELLQMLPPAASSAAQAPHPPQVRLVSYLG